MTYLEMKRSSKLHKVLMRMWRRRWMYILSLPGMIYLLLFKYVPIYGVSLAFKDFSFSKGILQSPWIGLQNFEELFGAVKFKQVFMNSLLLSLIKHCFTFPFPILLALLVNEMRVRWLKRTVQTFMYLPHFVSWVVLCSIVTNFLSVTDGIVNIMLEKLGGTRINFLASTEWFRTLITVTSIWKGSGWGRIIYLAGLTAINPEYYEAATVDGANRWQRLWYITLPGITNTIIIKLVLDVGQLMNNGFEQVYLMQSSLNIAVSDVFETYTYNIGISGGRYSYSTAVGLFKNVIGFILVYSTNSIAKKLGRRTLY